jgi:hypothetical protein
MNPLENRLDRLLAAAQNACPPIPPPTPWFEQRLVQLVLAELNPFPPAFEGIVIFRSLVFAAVIAVVSVALPLLRPANPYRETLDLVNSGVQLEQLQ